MVRSGARHFETLSPSRRRISPDFKVSVFSFKQRPYLHKLWLHHWITCCIFIVKLQIYGPGLSASFQTFSPVHFQGTFIRFQKGKWAHDLFSMTRLRNLSKSFVWCHRAWSHEPGLKARCISPHRHGRGWCCGLWQGQEDLWSRCPLPEGPAWSSSPPGAASLSLQEAQLASSLLWHWWPSGCEPCPALVFYLWVKRSRLSPWPGVRSNL